MKRGHSMSVDEKARKDTIVVHCDGACKGNGQVRSVTGIEVWRGNNNKRFVKSTLPPNFPMWYSNLVYIHTSP